MFIILPCFGIVLEIDGDGGHIHSDLHYELDTPERLYAINTLESCILAHAVAGVDVSSPAYIEGIEAVVYKMQNMI